MHIFFTVSKPCLYDGDFKCNDTGVCLSSYRVCNGYSECQGYYGSNSDYDEQNCGMYYMYGIAMLYFIATFTIWVTVLCPNYVLVCPLCWKASGTPPKCKCYICLCTHIHV